VALVEAAGVVAVELAHSLRQVFARDLEDEVVMGANEAVRVAAPIVESDGRAEELHEVDAVEIVLEEHRAANRSRRSVKEAVAELAAGNPRHAATVALEP
jgi:hypothetical protein